MVVVTYHRALHYTRFTKSIPTGYAIFPKWSNSASKMSEISPPVGPFCHFDALNRIWCATCTHKSMNIAHVVRCDPTGLTHWIVVIEPFDSSVDPFESNMFCAILWIPILQQPIIILMMDVTTCYVCVNAKIRPNQMATSRIFSVGVP